MELKDDKSINEIKSFLENNDVIIKSEVSISSFEDLIIENFINTEMKNCRRAFEGVLGSDTLDKISKEIKEAIIDGDIEDIPNEYYKKVMEYSDIIDKPTIGIHVITNNISIELKDILDDEVICVYGNDVYTSEIVIDEEDNDCVKIGEMLIPLNEFIRMESLGYAKKGA